MNLAILIGVSQYDNENDLPGCKNDVDIIYQLIRKTGKFQEILYISQDTDSQNVKFTVSEFIRNCKEKGTEVDEIFFYYTGHGLFNKDEFHFVLSDFDSQWLNKTTYKNSEIDDLLKSLNPDFTVKVIDACNSGVRYVKDVSNTEAKEILNVSGRKFKNCYFMFSSQFDEVSWADKNISYFTDSFINAIVTHQTNKSIRYRDIADYISDDFLQRNVTQTPYFITQTSNTETFCDVDDDIKKMLEERLTTLREVQVIKEDKDTTNELSLLEKIKKDAENYCKDIKEVQDILNKIKENMESFSLNEDIEEAYEVKAEFEYEEYGDLPNIYSVAKSMEGDAANFFIELNYAVEKVKTPVQLSPLRTFRYLATQGTIKQEYKEENQTVIKSFDITESDIPYTTVKIDLEPKYPNVPKYNLTLVYAFSKVHIKLFYSFNTYKEVSWGDFILDEIKWRQSEKFLIKNEEKIEKKIDSIILEFKDFMESNLREMFKVELDKKVEVRNVGTIMPNKKSRLFSDNMNVVPEPSVQAPKI